MCSCCIAKNNENLNVTSSLASFSSQDYERGTGPFKEALWRLVSTVLFEHLPVKCYRLKCMVLRCFGAEIGRNVVIKPCVKIMFPWKLQIGDNVWLGEECWILNVSDVTVEDNVCISQRAMLCSGSHDYKSPAFDLIARPIRIEQGSWVAVGSWVGPGVTVRSHAVLTAYSVATRDLEPYGIYQGNPATKIRIRKLEAK